jgi:two-component system sensor histidine kinase/response regulator
VDRCDPACLEACAAAVKGDRMISATRLVLVTSVPGGRSSGPVTPPPGFDAVLARPIKQVSLHGALSDAGALAPREGDAVQKRGPRHSRAPEEGPRVLLVEDNAVNQAVTVRVIEKLGYAVDLSANGRAALEAIGRAAYDLILMDCQMPEMDGYEATRAIRALPPPACDCPIVAMTAAAMAGDRDRCIDAGMDDYLAKPVQPQELARVVSWYLRADAPGSESAGWFPHLSAERLQAIAGDDRQVIRELADSFIAGAREALARLRPALATGRDADACREAHAIRGTSANIGAERLQETAGRFEASLNQGHIEEATALAEAMHREFAVARMLLRRAADGSQTPAQASSE